MLPIAGRGGIETTVDQTLIAGWVPQDRGLSRAFLCLMLMRFASSERIQARNRHP